MGCDYLPWISQKYVILFCNLWVLNTASQNIKKWKVLYLAPSILRCVIIYMHMQTPHQTMKTWRKSVIGKLKVWTKRTTYLGILRIFFSIFTQIWISVVGYLIVICTNLHDFWCHTLHWLVGVLLCIGSLFQF